MDSIIIVQGIQKFNNDVGATMRDVEVELTIKEDNSVSARISNAAYLQPDTAS